MSLALPDSKAYAQNCCVPSCGACRGQSHLHSLLKMQKEPISCSASARIAPLSAGDQGPATTAKARVLSTAPAARTPGPPLRFHRCRPRNSRPEQAHSRWGCTWEGGLQAGGSCRTRGGRDWWAARTPTIQTRKCWRNCQYLQTQLHLMLQP